MGASLFFKTLIKTVKLEDVPEIPLFDIKKTAGSEKAGL